MAKITKRRKTWTWNSIRNGKVVVNKGRTPKWVAVVPYSKVSTFGRIYGSKTVGDYFTKEDLRRLPDDVTIGVSDSEKAEATAKMLKEKNYEIMSKIVTNEAMRRNVLDDFISKRFGRDAKIVDVKSNETASDRYFNGITVATVDAGGKRYKVRVEGQAWRHSKTGKPVPHLTETDIYVMQDNMKGNIDRYVLKSDGFIYKAGSKKPYAPVKVMYRIIGG